jgi:hypothetical protein
MVQNVYFSGVLRFEHELRAFSMAHMLVNANSKYFKGFWVVEANLALARVSNANYA